MRIFKNKWFNRFCKKEQIRDNELQELIHELENGQINTNYGGFVIKQRLARKNEGKSGGYRNVILYRVNDKAFFVYGYAKKDRDNITHDEERAFKDLAKEMLNYDENILDRLVADGVLIEVQNEDK